MTIRTALCIVTTAAAPAAVVIAAGCAPGATAQRTVVSVSPATPQRALRIYPVGTLIVDVTARDRQSVDIRGAADQGIAPERTPARGRLRLWRKASAAR